MIKSKRLIALAPIALLLCWGSGSAQQISIAITPASINARVSRGASYTQTFTLINNTRTRLRFRCSLADMWYDENNNRVNGRPGTLQRSASLWVQFSAEQIIVEAHSSGTVNATVTVPADSSGSYYSVPVFEAMPAESVLPDASLTKISTAKATIGIRFNALMMLTTLDAVEYNVEVAGGQVKPPSASTELTMELDVRNRSNVHVFVRGAFAILTSAGNLAGRGTIAEKRYLPGQRNLLQTQWAGDLAPGNYTSIVTLSYDRVGMEPATIVYELPLVVQ